MMASLIDVTMNKNNIAPSSGNVSQPAVNTKLPDLPNDSVTLSSQTQREKEKDKNGFLKVAAMLGLIAAAAGGGTYGSVKIYDKYFNKLAISGIKKGEINDALYNFIKKIDPKGTMFHSKEEVLKINKKLTDDNFLILKQLAKMKVENPYSSVSRNRFTLNEITELLINTNEHNMKYLTQLAQKQTEVYGQIQYFSSADIIKVLKEINPNNEKVVGDLIEKVEVGKTEGLISCLKDVKSDNIDIYSLLLSTRRKGAPTELQYSEIQSLAEKIKETKNPKSAELFINAEKHDGTGNYRHDVDELKHILNVTSDEKYDIYKQLYELESTYQVKDMKPFITNVTKDNIDVLEPLLTKEVAGKYSFDSGKVFDDYNDIGEILGYTNEKNADILKQVIELIDSKDIFQGRSYNNIDVDKAVSRIMFHASTEDAIERATVLLNKGKSGESQTLTFKEFYDTFCGFNYCR